ncbi:hypothetical protein [Chitinibacter tainanensis]|uniref:hypothetical protein n=1 Tax=Chitinibacter tainanensis TaxID=230667 RepID=UPI0023558F0A|nr:hypothetical protein [Chitinibacter tainanensis]
MSDLHIDDCGYKVTDVDADLIVLAGDIAEGRLGLDWARKQFRYAPGQYVSGNHEYYGFDISEFDTDLAARAKDPSFSPINGSS